MQIRNKVASAMGVAIALPLFAVLMLGTAPAVAVEQCRFIQARPDREACYDRQAAELAAKRKPEPNLSPDPAMQSLEQMKHEDEALNRQLRNICRGC
jgi:hypothetical protein